MLSWLSGVRAPHPEIFKRPRRMADLLPARRADRDRSLNCPAGMVWIAGGSFLMGSDVHYPEEGPAHSVSVDGFWIDRHPVTNFEFDRFVQSSGYVTQAERAVRFDDGGISKLGMTGSLVFRRPPRANFSKQSCWDYVIGADWRHPSGPQSGVVGKSQHPVVHISYADAEAYAHWAGKELPTEAEWEFAARGGLDGAEYAWGEELMPAGYVMANTWQGEFPWQNLTCGGFEGTSPVGYFPANGHGLYDMIGNVWEWTADWYEPFHAAPPMSREPIHNPRGGKRERSMEARDLLVPHKVAKGGSFLCALNHSRRFRPAARMGQPVEGAACHLGFRCLVRQHGFAVGSDCSGF